MKSVQSMLEEPLLRGSRRHTILNTRSELHKQPLSRRAWDQGKITQVNLLLSEKALRPKSAAPNGLRSTPVASTAPRAGGQGRLTQVPGNGRISAGRNKRWRKKARAADNKRGRQKGIQTEDLRLPARRRGDRDPRRGGRARRARQGRIEHLRVERRRPGSSQCVGKTGCAGRLRLRERGWQVPHIRNGSRNRQLARRRGTK